MTTAPRTVTVTLEGETTLTKGRKVTITFEGVDPRGGGFTFSQSLPVDTGDNPRFYVREFEDTVTRLTSDIQKAIVATYGEPQP